MKCTSCQSELKKVYGKTVCPLCSQINNQRKTWTINPKTKIKDSKRKYNRQKVKIEIQEELNND